MYVSYPFLVQRTSAEIEVIGQRDDDIMRGTGKIPDGLKHAVKETLRRLSIPLVGWPGKSVLARQLAPGEEATELEASVAKLVDLELHTPTTEVTCAVKFAKARREQWGDSLVFDVSASAAASSFRRCDGWKSHARLDGSVLRAVDGAFVGLRLDGRYQDTQMVCRDREKRAKRMSPAQRATSFSK